MSAHSPEYRRFDWKFRQVDLWVDYLDVDGSVFGALGISGVGLIAGHPGLWPPAVNINSALKFAGILEEMASMLGDQPIDTPPARTLTGKLKSLLSPMWDYTIVSSREIVGIGIIRELRVVRRLNSDALSLVMVVDEAGYRFISTDTALKIASFIRQNYGRLA